MRVADSRRGSPELGLDVDAGCRFHYRAADAVCSGCGCGLCLLCLPADRRAPLCPDCRRLEADQARRRELRQRDAVALRRAGYAIPREGGDPVVLHRGPLRLALPAAGATALALGAGALTAYVQLHLGLTVVAAGVLLAVPLGQLVRVFFGGVSPVAGATAAAVTALAVGLGRWFAGAGDTLAGAPLGTLRARSDAYLGAGWGAVALLLLATLVAYAQAAGHRVSVR
ncbi:MAG TPA: hypothetical protein VI316_11140 [Candidatus Dormibacteraeota bacterium]